MKQKGKLIILSGFAGSGKGTIVQSLLKDHGDEYALSVSATTRSPRPGEKDGEHYFFLTKEQFEAAVRTGVNVVKDLKKQGYNFILTGEMGIGNTTPSTVITCALLNKNPDDVTGRGAGLSKSGFERKKLVIKSALKRIGPMIDKSDVVGICSSCGGFEIAAMTGLFIGGALYGVPVMCDGFISLAAALSAVKIAPECKGYIFGSHLSAEPAVECLTNALDIDVYVNCGMHLGEGTGAVSAFPLFKMACGVYNDMVTFNDIKIEAYKNFAEEEL